MFRSRKDFRRQAHFENDWNDDINELLDYLGVGQLSLGESEALGYGAEAKATERATKNNLKTMVG